MWPFTAVLSCLFVLFGILGGEVVQTKSPDVVTAQELEVKKAETSYLLVLFHDDACDDSAVCRQARTGLVGAVDASPEGSVLGVQTGDAAAAASYGVTSLPRIGYFRNGNPIMFADKAVEVNDLYNWMNQNRELCTRSLDDDTFEHDTQASTGATTGNWFIIFYSPECAALLPEWEGIACRLKNRLVTGAVDVSSNPAVRARFGIEACPTLVFFRQGKMYAYSSTDYHQGALTVFAEGGYSQVAPVDVPTIPSSMSVFMDSLKDKLKQKSTIVFVGVVAACIVVAVALVALCGGKKRSKFE